MKVIVLGAGGRLGSRVVQACVERGHQVTALVRSRQRLAGALGEELLQQVEVVEGDVADTAQLAAAMRGHEAAVQVRGAHPQRRGERRGGGAEAGVVGALSHTPHSLRRRLQVAGYIGATYEESRPLHELVVSATEAANEALTGARRLWVTGGAGGLRVGSQGFLPS